MFKYVCKCPKENFENKEYSYWENRDITSDELDVLNYIKIKCNLKKKKILHMGIGNSYLAKKLMLISKITGITISSKEINLAKKISNINYNVLFCDKYSIQFNSILKNTKFDYIIDTNLKSYSCCIKSFRFMFKNMVLALNKGGLIITSRNGMNWTKKLTPKLSFNLKSFFYYKLKEVNGKKENILSINECKKLAEKYSLNLFFNKKICFFKK